MRNPIKYTEGRTSLQIRASDPTGAKKNTELLNNFSNLQRPISMPLEIYPKEDARSSLKEIFNYNQDSEDRNKEIREMSKGMNKQESQNKSYAYFIR